MVSAAMAIQGQGNNTGSNTMVPTSNRISLCVDIPSTKIEQFQCEDDFAPKVRKPYTITKQRERWTEEEHKKFLEALKLYGRAWRRIEEHVGSKTAVQIRSHAQKFFSKVVRESTNGDSSSVKPIEIPPPRPKRKPLHPYPRKLASPVKSGTAAPEKPARSISPPMSPPGEENQSPTSVLSGPCSDAPGTTDSTTLDGSGSFSPVSSVVGANSVGFVLSELPDLTSKIKGSPTSSQVSSSANNRSPSTSQVNNCPTQDERIHLKLELFPPENAFVKEGSVEVSSTQCLKLFGKTVLVTDPCRPSSPTSGAGKLQPSDYSDGKSSETLAWDSNLAKVTLGNSECSQSALPCRASGTLYSSALQSEYPSTVDSSHYHSLPWWTYQGGLSFPFVQVHNPIPIKAPPLFDNKELHNVQTCKRGSSTGSDVESGSVETEEDKSIWAKCSRLLHEELQEGRELPLSNPRAKAFLQQRASSSKCAKGFVPYKRCLADRDTHLIITGEEREEQRIRLCL